MNWHFESEKQPQSFPCAERKESFLSERKVQTTPKAKMKNIRAAFGRVSREMRGLLILGILSNVLSVRESYADTLSLASSASYQQAINVTYSNPTVVGNTLQVTIQIQNTSGT